PTAADPGDDRPLDHPGPDPALERPARARSGHRRYGARPVARPGYGALAGRARPGPQRRGAPERGRSAGGPRRSRSAPRPQGPRPGPRVGGTGPWVVVRMETARCAGATPRPGRAGGGDPGARPG